MKDLDKNRISGPGNTHSPGRDRLSVREAASLSIRNVMVLSSEYDRARLDEGGSVISLLNDRYSSAELGFAPRLEYATTFQEASSLARSSQFDLLISLNLPCEDPLEDLVRDIRGSCPGIIVFYVSSGPYDLEMAKGREGVWDLVLYHVPGGRMVPSIVQIADDLFSLSSPGRSHIVCVRTKDVVLGSRVAVAVSDLIWEHIVRCSASNPSLHRKLEIISRRPRIVLMNGPGELKVDKDRKVHLLTDTDLSAFHRTSEGGIDLEGLKGSINSALRMGDIEIPDGEPIHDLRSLERHLTSLAGPGGIDTLYRSELRDWLISRAEFELVDSIEGDPKALSDPSKAASIVREHRLRSGKGHVSDFSREALNSSDFSRIGSGHLGGKGRGLAFLKLLLEEMEDDIKGGIEVRVPRTVILATDIYDLFMSSNGLDAKELEAETDERIVDIFLGSDLPSTVLGDLRDFISRARTPLVVRSSSLLEDALYQPFAGIYSSVMLSNTGHELDKRFRSLSMAIKYVYASTVLRKARSYLASTGSRSEQEKMAIVIQEVAGSWRGDLYYPVISGVGRSFDYWPFPCCASDDGTVNMALGLGKTIVDGGSVFRFCPLHPRACTVASIDERVSRSQKGFYALKMGSIHKSSGFTEDVQMVVEDLPRAESDGVLDQIASTYDPQNDRIHPGTGRDGPRIIDFAPILELETVPLSPLLKDLLDRAQYAMGAPVEIEFAMELEPSPVLYLLQVRSMRGREGTSGIDLEDVPSLLRSGKTMGNGHYDLYDVVMVNNNTLDKSTSPQLISEISRINAELVSKGRKYTLIGPGRWGSCDPWLGIPVQWDDISGVGVIIERPVGDRSIDPSQGSHFFHNIASLNLGYLTLSTAEDRAADWSALSGEPSTGLVTHRRSERAIRVIIDGHLGKGIIAKGQGG